MLPFLAQPTTSIPVTTTTAVPLPAPSTIVQTITVPAANVTVEAPGALWWPIPLATLIAAVVAGSFLTINEALKRNREDRRQWDKELRDMYLIVEKASGELLNIHYRPDNAYTETASGKATDAADLAITTCDAMILIAQPVTERACIDMVSSCHNIHTKIARGEYEQEDRGDLIRSRERLEAAIKYQNRIGSMQFELDRVLRHKSRLYRHMPRFMKRRFYLTLAERHNV